MIPTLTNESRRFFTFRNSTGVEGEFFGIIFEERGIRFPTNDPDNVMDGKTVFKAPSECAEWLIKFEDAKNMRNVVKSYQANIKAFEPSDEEWAKMLKIIPDPNAFQKSDFVAIDTRLANNVMDRDAERLSLGVLQSFTKSIVGKSKLNNHNWFNTGEGRFFDSRLLKYDDPQEFSETLGFVPYKKFINHLKRILDIEGGLYWFAPKFYMHVIDSDAITRMKAGVTSPMSIGFRYPLLVDVKDEKSGELLWREYRNSENQEAEALEGSHVFLGAQYGASSKFYNVTDENSGCEEESEMPINLKMSIGEFTLQADGENAEFIAAVESKVQELEQVKTLNQSLETQKVEAENAKAKAEDDLAAMTAENNQLDEKIKQIEAEKDSLKSEVVEMILQNTFQAGQMKWDEADGKRAELMVLTPAELTEKHRSLKGKKGAISFEPKPEKPALPNFHDRSFISD